MFRSDRVHHAQNVDQCENCLCAHARRCIAQHAHLQSSAYKVLFKGMHTV